MERIRKILLLQVLILAFGVKTPAYADEDSDLEAYINASSYMLEENRDYFSQKSIDKLERWIRKAKKSLENSRQEKARGQDLEKSIEEAIVENFQNRSEFFTIFINDYIKEEKVHDIFNEALKDDGYFYYGVYKGANISTNYYEDVNEKGEYFVESVDFTMTYRQSEEEEEKVEDFAETWVMENIDSDMEDLEKIKTIHDFIVKRNSYYTGDENEMSDGYSIYSPGSILFGQGGVCNAYATLFDAMASRAGLTTYYSTGQIKENGQLHIWNMVKLDNDWYNIDLTWDDPVLSSDQKILNEDDYVSYDYFLVSDDQIKETKTIDRDEKRIPAAKSYDHGFENTEIQFEKTQGKLRKKTKLDIGHPIYYIF